MGGCYRILENIVRKKLLILIMVAFVDKDGFIYDIYRVTIVVLYYVLVLSVCSVLMLEM